MKLKIVKRTPRFKSKTPLANPNAVLIHDRIFQKPMVTYQDQPDYMGRINQRSYMGYPFVGYQHIYYPLKPLRKPYSYYVEALPAGSAVVHNPSYKKNLPTGLSIGWNFNPTSCWPQYGKEA